MIFLFKLNLILFLSFLQITAMDLSKEMSAPAQNTVDLHQATKSADEKTVESLIAQGADCSKVDENGNTALHYASTSGIARLLIQAHSPIDAQNKKGETPLFCAVANNNEAVTGILLSANADTLICDTRKYTALHVASARGTANIVDRLVSHKYVEKNKNIWNQSALKHNLEDLFSSVVLNTTKNEPINNYQCMIDAADKHGYTPLHLAVTAENAAVKGKNCTNSQMQSAQADFKKIITLLCSHGATIGKRDNRGNSPLEYAAKWGLTQLVEFFLLHLLRNKHPTDFLNYSMRLYCALVNNDEAAALRTIQAGTSMDQCICIMKAIEDDNQKVLCLLIKLGAKLNERYKGYTPLHIAIRLNKLKIAAIFLKHGAHVDTKAEEHPYDTALTIAIRKRNMEAIKLLLENNADANRALFIISTPLRLAALSNNREIVYELLTHGAVEQNLDTYPNESESAFENKCNYALAEFMRFGLGLNCALQVNNPPLLHTLASAVEKKNEKQFTVYFNEWINMDRLSDMSEFEKIEKEKKNEKNILGLCLAIASAQDWFDTIQILASYEISENHCLQALLNAVYWANRIKILSFLLTYIKEKVSNGLYSKKLTDEIALVALRLATKTGNTDAFYELGKHGIGSELVTVWAKPNPLCLLNVNFAWYQALMHDKKTKFSRLSQDVHTVLLPYLYTYQIIKTSVIVSRAHFYIDFLTSLAK